MELAEHREPVAKENSCPLFISILMFSRRTEDVRIGKRSKESLARRLRESLY